MINTPDRSCCLSCVERPCIPDSERTSEGYNQLCIRGAILDEKAEYGQRLLAAIRERLCEQPLTFFDVVRSAKGAYPTVVRDALNELVPEVIRDNLEGYRIPPSPSAVRSRWHSVLSGIEGNPILSSWYFTPETCERIGVLRDWSGLRLAFLGTPRLFEWFATHKFGRERALLDLDVQVLRALEMIGGGADKIVSYDVSHQVPEKFLRKFDYVFFDPPWYPQEYFVWFERAVALSASGEVAFSLFQELLRPSAFAERMVLLRNLIEPAASQTILPSFLQYEVPTFEKAELRAAGFASPLPWKMADWAMVKVPLVAKRKKLEQKPLERKEWTEVNIGKLRIFVAQNHVPKHQDTLLAQADAGLVLSSPSRRNPARQAMNVVTSRGHGLRTSRPTELLELLRAIGAESRKPDMDYIQRLSVDQHSRTLLEEILRSNDE